MNTLIGETETLIASCYENGALKYVNSKFVTDAAIAEIETVIETARAKCETTGTTESEYNASLETLGQMKSNLATAIENANNEAAARNEKRGELNTLIAVVNELITLCATTPGDATETLINEVADAMESAEAVANYKGSTVEELVAATEALQAKYDVLNVAQQSTAKTELRALIAQTEALIAQCGTVEYVTTTSSVALQTGDANANFWLSTNADQNVVGNSADGEGIAALLDGSINTYMHTQWGGDPVDDDHYVQVSLGSNQGLAAFTFTYATRYKDNPEYNSPAPSVIKVYGSVNGENFTNLLATFPSDDPDNALPLYTFGIGAELVVRY